jgi:gas vesicle protein
MKKKKVIFGIIAGISIGAIVAILLSDKGAEARKKILEKTSDLGSSIKDSVVSFIRSGKSAVAASN